jgi:uncharacterized RDD family membrane protein YckC
MKCQGCGHDYPSTITRCTRCGLVTPRRVSKSSRLIEFPRKPISAANKQVNTSPQPAWKAELSEKVKAAKAKRSGETIHNQSSADRVESPTETNPAYASKTVLPRDTGSGARPDCSTGVNSREQAHPRTSRGNDAIVEAALTRARRASENASRATLPKIGKPQAVPNLPKTKEATARALEPSTVSRPQPEPEIRSFGRTTQPLASLAPLPESEPTNNFGVQSAAPVQITQPLTAIETDREQVVAPLDEIEPRDYLAAEIKRVDRVLKNEFTHNERPPLFAHLLASFLDLLVIGLSIAPFLALIEILNGDFAGRRTRIAAAAVVFLVTFLYLAITQCLSGKTFGMMATNMRIVDAQTYEPLPPRRALLRAAGYFIAAAPVMLGLIWSLFDRRRRGWHDYLSGTLVARDF